MCNDGHMGNTLYCPTTRKIGPFVLDFTVCLVYEKNTWSLFLPLAVVVIQKSITFIDYVKGGQLPRMLHFVYRVPKVLQERGQTVSFVILKRITRAKRARDIFIESFHVYLLHTRNACSKKREFSVELFMYFHVCRLMSL